jgi:hypothetical protein
MQVDLTQPMNPGLVAPIGRMPMGPLQQNMQTGVPVAPMPGTLGMQSQMQNPRQGQRQRLRRRRPMRGNVGEAYTGRYLT